DALRAAFIFGIDKVGPNGLNLVEHVLLTSHANRYDQNEGRSPDDHAEGSEGEAHLVAAESIVGEAENLAVDETRPRRGRRCRRLPILVCGFMRRLLHSKS